MSSFQQFAQKLQIVESISFDHLHCRRVAVFKSEARHSFFDAGITCTISNNVLVVARLKEQRLCLQIYISCVYRQALILVLLAQSSSAFAVGYPFIFVCQTQQHLHSIRSLRVISRSFPWEQRLGWIQEDARVWNRIELSVGAYHCLDVISPDKGSHSTCRRSRKDYLFSLLKRISAIHKSKMRSGDDPSSKVKSSILVFDGGFGVALMKSSVAVQENCFGPVCEDIVMRFI